MWSLKIKLRNNKYRNIQNKLTVAKAGYYTTCTTIPFTKRSSISLQIECQTSAIERKIPGILPLNVKIIDF